MQIRDRIKDFRRVRADQLRPHPCNWRTHPVAQQTAMRGVLAEIGYADALVARELPDGSLQLVDGHLRAELTPEALVPVLVLDIDDAEALKLLATLDPLAAMAETDSEMLDGLLAQVETENESLRAMLDRLASGHSAELNADELHDFEIPQTFQVVVECGNEEGQRSLFERLTSEGFKCRLSSL